MHPKSRDRSGNDKLISDTEKDRQPPRTGPGKRRGRQSKYGRRLEAMKLRKAIRAAYGEQAIGDADGDGGGETPVETDDRGSAEARPHADGSDADTTVDAAEASAGASPAMAHTEEEE